MISSRKSRVPRDFQKFLKNGNNKARLMELFKSYLIDKRVKVLNLLRSNIIYYSLENECTCIRHSGVTVEEQLASDQEEADTKIILHARYELAKSFSGYRYSN